MPAPVSVAVFARAPIAGHAKTRLIRRLGADGAAKLQQCLVQRAVRTALSANVGPVSLWCTPDCSHPAFVAIRRETNVELCTQRGGDLGARMHDAIETLCRTGHALLIGSDCPALTVATLRAAAQALGDGSDAVVVPAEDGGYVLVGLRRADRSLFDAMPWSSDHVMIRTRERLRQAGSRWRELDASWDVDRPEDVDRLCASGLMPEVGALVRRSARDCAPGQGGQCAANEVNAGTSKTRSTSHTVASAAMAIEPPRNTTRR